MKSLSISIFILLQIQVFAQVQFGWKPHKGDSLYVEMFFEGPLMKSVGTYTNGQIKYTRFEDRFYIKDTVKYYNREGDITAIVDYNNLSYELIDSSYRQDFNFVDSCLALVGQTMKHCFADSGIQEFMYLNLRNSYQYSPPVNYTVVRSPLYEPVDYNIDHCYITYNSKDMMQRFQPTLSFKIDSNLQISQSKIDINKKYELNYNIDFANELKAKYGFKDFTSKENNRVIKIIGPYLQIRQKKFYWIIERKAGSNRDHVPGFILYDDYTEEIQIDVETGSYEKQLKFTSSIGCY